jgi:hypothetical protein
MRPRLALASMLVAVLELPAFAADAPAPDRSTSAVGEVDKALSSGPALAAGLGSQTSGLGAQLDCYWRPSGTSVGFAAHLGGGVSWPSGVAPSAGVFVFIGDRHRFIVDAAYGVLAGFQYDNEMTVNRLGFGPSLSLGYELMAKGGVFFRAAGGAGYIFGPVGHDAGVFPAVNLAVGYKIL